MSSLITTDILQEIANRSGLSFNKVLDNLQASILGFIQRRDIFKLAAKANVVVWQFPEPDKRFIPILEASLMRFDFAVSFSGTAPKLFIRTYNSNQEYDEQVLSGLALSTNVSKSFDKQIKVTEKYNIFFDEDCTIEYMKITEIPVNS